MREGGLALIRQLRQIIIANLLSGEILMKLAFYGTLRDPDVRRLVLGPLTISESVKTVTVQGWACIRIEGEAYPLLRSDPDAFTTFDLHHDFSEDAWRRLIDYEGEEYLPARIEIDGQSYHVFLAESFVKASDEAWDLETFQRRDKTQYLREFQ